MAVEGGWSKRLSWRRTGLMRMGIAHRNPPHIPTKGRIPLPPAGESRACADGISLPQFQTGLTQIPRQPRPRRLHERIAAFVVLGIGLTPTSSILPAASRATPDRGGVGASLSRCNPCAQKSTRGLLGRLSPSTESDGVQPRRILSALFIAAILKVCRESIGAQTLAAGQIAL